ncbi:EAL domain-containing protein [Vibrio mangrovi]|uniref:Phytochrome-like protein cph2 n=1 Tax=Vibrio mangrovi TaxID=474394 RepID=A0A1Y6ISS9_9VIBR|nr:transporter substrate-binding domain-containing protein [Vibrio mangrovi]MDW6001292.1 transporter substrate-binding domain-containing protein [Vibrio mangrovi]SMS00688.1 Phytochrome-like protein cph2 [Vibrio mangrovi]
MNTRHLLLLSLTLFFIQATIAQAAVPAEELPLQLTAAQQLWLNQHDRITIGAMDDWPPLDFINLEGKPDGFGVALVALLNQRLGGRLKLTSGKWPELYEQVIENKLDALLDITPKPSRKPYFNFTQPYLNIPHVIIGRNEAPYYVHESALVGKTIALEQGFGNVTYYRENYPSIHIREYANTSEALDAVARGEADAYIGNRAVANYIINREILNNLKVHGRAGTEGSILAIGSRKDQPILARILQLALSSISSQEYHAILTDIIQQQTALNTNEALKLTLREKQWLADHPIIRLASDPYWPPLEYFDKDGSYQGIAADFIRLIEKKIGISFVRSPEKQWSELVKDVRERRLDLFSLAMNTPERQNYSQFTQPYVSNTIVIITLSSVDFVPGMEGLAGKTVALEKGYATNELLNTNHPEIQLKTYPNTEAALLAVVRGDAFAYVGNIATSSYIIQDKALGNLKVSGETPYQNDLAFGVRSDWPELVHILNKALNSISAREKAEIFSRWVRVEVSSSIPWGWIITISLILVASIVMTLYWNYLLKQKVRERTFLLEYRSLHDSLTGLPNRTALMEQLSQRVMKADREGTSFAVLFIDVDDFKKVNDTLGHSIGDELLLAISKRLKAFLNPSMLISRFGGDEFIVLSDDYREKISIGMICQRLLQTMATSYQLDNICMSMTLSIGVACYPTDGESGEELLRNADTAMYVSKKQGGNYFHFFSSDLNAQMHRRIHLEEQFMTALKNQEFALVFQPIVNIRSGEIKKFEVLSRWHNPKLGHVAPSEFIPLAEHNGFILKLGEYVLSEALAACARLRRSLNQDYTVTVNVSPKQMNTANFVDLVSRLLQAHRLPPQALILEMTEGVLIQNHKKSEEVMNSLVRMGIHLAMDDFGTGYSSLSYVRNFPFHVLKIDREFVQDLSTDDKGGELVEAVLAMAGSLHIDVIAEGVETQSQEQRLLELGCIEAQGYYYSRPLPEKSLEQWLKTRSHLEKLNQPHE